ncbi:MAG: hypothetical protein AB7J32_18075 [Pseudonocardia sp.]
MIIDCESCDVRPVACGDCVVGVLLGVPGTEGAPVVQLDVSERRALDVLADQGLVPRLRLVAPQAGGPAGSQAAEEAHREAG